MSRVKIPSYYGRTPATTVELLKGDCGVQEVIWQGERIGYVWKGYRTYSPPTHKGSRIVRYHKSVPEWRGHPARPWGLRRDGEWGDTRQRVLQRLIERHIEARVAP